MKKYHIISNPAAGKKKTKTKNTLELVENVFLKNGVDFETHFSQGEKDATRIVRELTKTTHTQAHPLMRSVSVFCHIFVRNQRPTA